MVQFYGNQKLLVDGESALNCPICDENLGIRFRARYVDAAKCQGCGHLYATDVAGDHGVQDIPDPEAQLRAYQVRNLRLIAKWQRDKFIAPGSTILDYGAGSGHILRSLRIALPLTDLHCVEADRNAASYLSQLGLKVLPDLDAVKRQGYDSILLIELLEHLSDPVQFLRSIKSKLKPGGRIFMSTPIGELRSGSRDLTTYDTPEHVQFWTERSFAMACEKAALTFTPLHPGIMYPRKNKIDALLRDAAQSLRDAIQGRRHLVGYLSCL